MKIYCLLQVDGYDGMSNRLNQTVATVWQGLSYGLAHYGSAIRPKVIWTGTPDELAAILDGLKRSQPVLRPEDV